MISDRFQWMNHLYATLKNFEIKFREFKNSRNKPEPLKQNKNYVIEH